MLENLSGTCRYCTDILSVVKFVAGQGQSLRALRYYTGTCLDRRPQVASIRTADLNTGPSKHELGMLRDVQ